MFNITCQAHIICYDFECSDKIRADFVSTCKKGGIWNFDKEQIMDNISEKLVYLYRLELMMGKSLFKSHFEKRKITPFFPLISLPNPTHELYETYVEQQQISNVDLITYLK